jgi:hypothetical protein
VAWVLAFVSLVAILQGAAWLGPREGPPRAWRGAALMTAGIVGLGLALCHLLVPGLFA